MFSGKSILDQIQIEVGGVKRYHLISQSIPAIIDLGSYGRLGISCLANDLNTLAQYYLIQMSNGMQMLRIKEEVNMWPGAFGIDGKLQRLDKIITWGEPKANEIPAAVTDMLHFPRADTDIILHEQSINRTIVCTIITENLHYDTTKPICTIQTIDTLKIVDRANDIQ
ncbi:unnamed protein product [Gordionus sp. m RMFG-2023]